VCDLETSRMGAPYIYDISHLRVNMSNLFTKIYNILYYTTNLYLLQVLKMMTIHFNAPIDTFHHVPRNFS
jgi:hypothetical protein